VASMLPKGRKSVR